MSETKIIITGKKNASKAVKHNPVQKTDGTPLIRLSNIKKTFGKQTILNGVDLTIQKGEITTIIGKSGVGKSVLLKHIIGLILPDSGDIFINGKPLNEMKKPEKKSFMRKLSYMFQNSALFDSMTVFENVALPLKEKSKLSKVEIKNLVRNKLNLLGLYKIEDKFPSQLSGGMKKRVALARALITEPEIVLFDEPTTGLDPILKNAVHDMISDYQKKFGFTGIVISHEIPDVFYFSQSIAMLYEGRIIYQASPDDFQKVRDPMIQHFIKGRDIRYEALRDAVPRTYEEMKLDEEISRYNRENIVFSLIVLEISNFAELIETLGYRKVQTVLRYFATQVRNQLRLNDTCFRFGRSKIIVLLQETKSDQAKVVCEKLGNKLKKMEFLEIRPHPDFCISLNAGISQGMKNIGFYEMMEKAETIEPLTFQFSVCHKGEEL